MKKKKEKKVQLYTGKKNLGKHERENDRENEGLKHIKGGKKNKRKTTAKNRKPKKKEEKKKVYVEQTHLRTHKENRLRSEYFILFLLFFFLFKYI